jgi:hypothetical protein
MNSVELAFHPSANLRRGMVALVAVGIITFVAGLLLAPARIWQSMLLVSYYLLSVGAAATVLIALHYVSGASWSVAIRRVPEAMTAAIALGAVGLLFVFLAHPSLYPWSNVAYAAAMPAFRRWWLNLGFFRLRALAYVLIWLAFTWALLRHSRAQDIDAKISHTRRNISLGAAFLVVFGITYWLASYDWIMSIEPTWASTIFGMYNFSGLFCAGLAVLAILLAGLRRQQPLSDFITGQHLHDVGKLMFAFSTFWMYLWFSQYMLIWYANIPDETVHFIRRQHGFWQPLMLLNVALNWVVPFFALMPQRNKQRPGVLVKVAIAMLLGHWLDLYLMIAPSLGGGPQIGGWEIGLLAGGVGVFALSFFAGLRRAPVVPVNDPSLDESLHYSA